MDKGQFVGNCNNFQIDKIHLHVPIYQPSPIRQIDNTQNSAGFLNKNIYRTKDKCWTISPPRKNKKKFYEPKGSSTMLANILHGQRGIDLRVEREKKLGSYGREAVRQA